MFLSRCPLPSAAGLVRCQWKGWQLSLPGWVGAVLFGASLFVANPRSGAAEAQATVSWPNPAPGVAASQYKYQKPTLQQALTNRGLAFQMAEDTQRKIVGTMHPVETGHFLIFSAWNWSNDASLGDLCERMYQMLSQQFQVPAQEQVWIGKCPIYLFWDPAHYDRFISEIDQSRILDPATAHANGYHATRGRFSYIVINGVSKFGRTADQAKIEFYHVLVHEGTHAFLDRYVSGRPLPVWVEEGLADFIAASLVPQSEVNRKYVTATRSALHNLETVNLLLEKKSDLTPAEYGLAQSLVRTLVNQDRNAMVRFLELMKEGKSEETALTESYHVSRREFVRAWAVLWQRELAVR